MDGAGLPGKGEPLEADFLSGGTQNVIYRIRRGENDCVLRMPPPDAPPDRDKGILREWRIIEALDGTEVPHTAAVGVCPDASVLGRPFYLMGFVDGWSPMELDAAASGRSRSTPTSPHAESLAYQLAEGIALLSKVDWKAKGLQDLGRPDGFHERQVDRWIGFFERIKGREIDGLDEATEWLRAHKPLDFIPGLMHGDYQFANVMYRHGAPAQLAAIVDWEMGTVGDPKLDLGWMVQSWPERHRCTEAVGDELRRYARNALSHRGGRPLRRRSPAGRSTTSTTTWCWRSGSSRSSSSRAFSAQATTRSCWPTVPSSSDLMRSAADLAESTDYTVTARRGLPGVRAARGRPDRGAAVAGARSRPGQGAGRRRGGQLSRRPARRQPVSDQRAHRRSWSAASSPASSSKSPTGQAIWPSVTG